MMDFLYSYHVPNRTLGKGRSIFTNIMSLTGQIATPLLTTTINN